MVLVVASQCLTLFITLTAPYSHWSIMLSITHSLLSDESSLHMIILSVWLSRHAVCTMLNWWLSFWRKKKKWKSEFIFLKGLKWFHIGDTFKRKHPYSACGEVNHRHIPLNHLSPSPFPPVLRPSPAPPPPHLHLLWWITVYISRDRM